MRSVSCLKKREERTTEGGLEVAREEKPYRTFHCAAARCWVSGFNFSLLADQRQIEAAHRIGAQVIELHTGAYCDFHAEGNISAVCDTELQKLTEMSSLCTFIGLGGACRAWADV